MMKKTMAIVLTILLAAFLIIPASAVTGSVGKYTPVLDGEKDEAYDQSIKINVYTDQGIAVGEFFHSEGDAPEINSTDATAWFLYDDEFIYVFVDVKNNDVYDIGKELFDSRDNSYQSNSIELWFVFNDSDPYIKFSTVAHNYGVFGDNIDVNLGYDATAKIKSSGWTAEYKIPIKQYGLKEGGTFYVTLQHNAMDSNENLVVSGRQAATVLRTLPL